MSSAALQAIAAQARDWLFDAALPLWSQAGFDDRTGLFQELLGQDGRPVEAPRRVRVQARQTYVFAEAGRLGWSGPWRERVEAGVAVLAGPARAEAGAVGHRLDGQGALIDPRRDLYDQAFALLALAAARAVDPASADRRIGDLLGYLETRRAPDGGFKEGEVQASPRRQNPHMHLFEAAMTLVDAGVERGRALAAEIATLFDEVFFDRDNGALGEFYDDDWSRAPGDQGRLAEPGHHFEWIWLLDRWRRMGGGDRTAAALGLWDHALANGLQDGVAIDEMRRDGGAKTLTARLWPQTERLKAALALLEHTGEPVYAEAAVAAYAGLWRYLGEVRPGLWRDRLDAHGQFVDEPAPASSFYHIVVALSELMRVAAADARKAAEP